MESVNINCTNMNEDANMLLNVTTMKFQYKESKLLMLKCKIKQQNILDDLKNDQSEYKKIKLDQNKSIMKLILIINSFFLLHKMFMNLIKN